MNDLYKDSNKGGVFQENASGLQVSSAAQSSLYSSKGWVRFLSVLGFICFAISVMVTISTMTVISYMGGVGFLSFLLIAVMTVIIFMLSLRLSKFSSAIGRMELTRQSVEFELAMVEQMKFWRLMGILTLIWIVLAVVGIFGGLMA